MRRDPLPLHCFRFSPFSFFAMKNAGLRFSSFTIDVPSFSLFAAMFSLASLRGRQVLAFRSEAQPSSVFACSSPSHRCFPGAKRAAVPAGPFPLQAAGTRSVEASLLFLSLGSLFFWNLAFFPEDGVALFFFPYDSASRGHAIFSVTSVYPFYFLEDGGRESHLPLQTQHMVMPPCCPSLPSGIPILVFLAGSHAYFPDFQVI